MKLFFWLTSFLNSLNPTITFSQSYEKDLCLFLNQRMIHKKHLDKNFLSKCKYIKNISMLKQKITFFTF